MDCGVETEKVWWKEFRCTTNI